MANFAERLRQLWSTTEFGDRELHAYARRQLVDETRRGVMAMSLLSLGLVIAALPVCVELELGEIYLYTYLLIGILSIHIYFAARGLGDINTLYLLGMTLLTISAVAFVSIAHQTSSFSVLLFANIVLLFMVVPMVPWGLREAACAIFIIYASLTLSAGGAAYRFGTETIWVLQFFMVAAAVTSIVLVARSVRVRKDNISARFDLEKAQAYLFQLSNVDPLTGAYNRRFMRTAIERLTHDFAGQDKVFHYALMDLDDLKILNDTYGHEFGDRVLKCIGESFSKRLNDDGYLIRLGGDEFALLLVHDDPHEFVGSVIADIEQTFEQHEGRHIHVSVSYGLVSAPLCDDVTFTSLYQLADESLYASKRESKAGKPSPVSPMSATVS